MGLFMLVGARQHKPRGREGEVVQLCGWQRNDFKRGWRIFVHGRNLRHADVSTLRANPLIPMFLG